VLTKDVNPASILSKENKEMEQEIFKIKQLILET
jgi:hypothetical protein